jgi:hypothetical protein
MLGLFLAASGAHAATDKELAGLTPDSYFYFLDRLAQWVDLKLTFDPVRKIEKKLQYASEKMAEMKTLKEDNKLDKKTAKSIETDYDTLTADTTNSIDALKSEGKDVAELVKKMEEQSSEHTAKLEEVLNGAPEEARDALEHALEVSKRGHERAIEALSKEIEEGNIKEEELGENTKSDIKDSKEKKHGEKVEGLKIEDGTDDISNLLNEMDQNRSGAGAAENELNNL